MTKSIIGKANAIAIYIAWVFLAVLVVGLFGVMFKISEVVLFIPVGFVGLVFFGSIHFVLSFQVRCPNCNKMLTFQSTKKPKYSPSSHLDGWAYTAIKWFTGTVRCIHCGAEVDTNAL